MFVRWFTPNYTGCNNAVPPTHVVRKTFHRLKLLSDDNAYAVVDLAQIIGSVHMVPDFSDPAFWYLNNYSLGTAMHAYTPVGSGRSEDIRRANGDSDSECDFDSD